MRAYRIKTDQVISPFNEHPRDLLVLNERVGDCQERLFKRLGIELVTVDDASKIDNEERLTFYDHTYFTEGLARQFIEESRKSGRATACCLKKGAFTKRSVPGTMSVRDEQNSFRYQVHYYPAGARPEDPSSVVIDPDGTIAKIRFPKHMVEEVGYEVPLLRRGSSRSSIGATCGGATSLVSSEWHRSYWSLRNRSCSAWH